MRERAMLDRAYLDQQVGELLPGREALALVSLVNVTAVNLAIAVNAAGAGSQAVALAGQTIHAIRI